MRLSKASLSALGLLAGGVLALSGCQDCDTSGVKVDFNQGITSRDRTHYESSPVDGEWLHFPPGRTYRLGQDLRAGSLSVQSYVAFPDDHDSGKRPSSYAAAAGNQVVFEVCSDDGNEDANDDDSADKCRNDDQEQNLAQHIRVRNDTCAEFFLRIVADVAPTDGLASMGGAGGVSNGGAPSTDAPSTDSE